jgi:hypothetical protein
MQLPKEVLEKAKAAAAKIDADVYVYNGGIERPRDLFCVEAIFSHRTRKKAVLFLVTNGGNPDAAYKMARYFQDHYDDFLVVVAGKCKSAGTLIAVGAKVTPYGELGPLDIQLSKVDRFDALQSGLTIEDALNTLEARALTKFYEMVKDYISANKGLLSFASATKAASDFVTQLYAPVFARIDPEEVGARARSMKIAIDYGRRLSVKWQNMKKDTLRLLSETYSSHSFVIDQLEAETLFNHVRKADANEIAVISALGRYARFEVPDANEFVFQALSNQPSLPKTTQKSRRKKEPADETRSRGNPPKNGGNPKRTNATPLSTAASPRKRARTTNGRRIQADEPRSRARGRPSLN